jgi:hypothetical protein
VHEGEAAGGQPALEHQRVPRGDEHLRDRGGVGDGDARGHPYELALVDGAPRCVAAPAHDAHHLVADGPRRDPLADGGDAAGELEAGDLVRRRRGRLRVEAHPLQHVGPVQGGGDDVDHDLLRAGHRVGDVVVHPEDLWPTLLREDDRSHPGIMAE